MQTVVGFDLGFLRRDGLPDHARLTTFLDPVHGASFIVRVGVEEERFDVGHAKLAAAPSIEAMLGTWADGLPNRFRASWARAGEPWPDCLPPMFGEVEVEPERVFVDVGQPPMMPEVC